MNIAIREYIIIEVVPFFGRVPPYPNQVQFGAGLDDMEPKLKLLDVGAAAPDDTELDASGDSEATTGGTFAGGGGGALLFSTIMGIRVPTSSIRGICVPTSSPNNWPR